MSDDASITECLGRNGGLHALSLFPSPIKGIRNYCLPPGGIPPFFLLSFLLSREFHPLNRSYPTDFIMEINPTQTTTMELEAMEAKENNDDRDMARLGKSPVLKVKRSLFPQVMLLELILIT